MKASCAGIPYTTRDTRSPAASAVKADIHAAFLNTPSIRNSTTIGIAANSAEIPRLPATGS
jgi:hypothetical protein